MNLPLWLQKDKIDSITYDSIFLEKPIADIVDFDYKTLLSSPPKNTDKSVIDELRLISNMTHSRTKDDKKFVYQIDENIDQFFIRITDKYKLDYPIEYINEFYDIVSPIIMNTKGFWNRPRPSQLAQIYNIHIDIIITDTINTPSYPSGHVVYSSLVASILKNIYPQIDKKLLDDIVLDTAKARVMQGVHYPSDNKASIVFTKKVFNILNPKLRKDYYESF